MKADSTSTWIEIDRARLSSNVQAFKTLLDPDCALMIVVKANAYGHGLEGVAASIAPDADWLGVNSLDEALTLRRLGLESRIAILGHTPLGRAREIVAGDFRQVLFRVDQAKALSDAALAAGTRLRVHLKVETGTHRLGIPLDETAAFVQRLKGLSGLELEGIYTHFANIEDTLDPSFARRQLDRFRRSLDIVRREGGRPSVVHASATAGTLLYPETHFGMVRVGIGAYGIWPSRETRLAARERGKQITLRPVLQWKTRIAQVKDVGAGEFVGYGLTFEARRPMQVAVLPVGYYDGYDRKLSNAGRVLVHGQSVPIVGRVAMNMTVVDVTGVGAAAEDEVVLVGRQQSGEITADEIAERTGTIPYEVLSRIHPEIPRFVSGE